MFQMLDAMLVMYIDLPARMNPGVSGLLHYDNHDHYTILLKSRFFLHHQTFFFSTMEQVCQLYILLKSYCNDVMPTGEWDMKQPGIIALAHPLDTQVATRHGVFVFEDIEEIRKRYREGNEGYYSVIR